MLKIEHLKKRFGGHMVIDDVSLEVAKGEIRCVIGQSGCGKSVILKHTIGLMIPDGGRITLEGEEISSPAKRPSDLNKARRRFGMLFQGAALFDSMNVGENLAFPLREHTTHTTAEIDQIVSESLEMVGLREEVKTRMASELSGGMRSRVGLARALVMKPEIMLYDEPTSALDPIMTDKINDLILSLRDKLGMTSVVVTHDIGSAYKIADKIAMIHEGKIIFDGTPGEIRKSRNPYVAQFIRGQRKLYYAVEDEQSYAGQFDADQVRKKDEKNTKFRLKPRVSTDGATKPLGSRQDEDRPKNERPNGEGAKPDGDNAMQ